MEALCFMMMVVYNVTGRMGRPHLRTIFLDETATKLSWYGKDEMGSVTPKSGQNINGITGTIPKSGSRIWLAVANLKEVSGLRGI